jgi:predicted dehydrogenase
MVLRVAIAGCGRIGVLFDQPGHPYILSHAHAITVSPEFELVGVMDADAQRAKDAAVRWGTKAYTSLDTLMKEEQPDVVCVCVPNQFHDQYLHQLLSYPLKAVVAEKPLTTDLQSTKEIVAAFQKSNIPLFVNYTRCYDLKMREVRDLIRNQDMGQLIHAVMKYSKGIMHNGSHMIAAANFLLGSYQSGYPVSAIVDHEEHDPTLSAVMKFEYGSPVYLTGCDERRYSVFEIDLLMEQGRFVFEELGFRFRRYDVREDPLYPGDHDLCLDEQGETGMKQSLVNLWQQVFETVEQHAPVLCGGELALQTQTVCSDLLRQHQHDH